MKRKVIKLKESVLRELIAKIIIEQTVKRDSGFEKYPCVSSMSGYDLNGDGSVDMYTPALAQTGESKQYYANGTMKYIDGSGKTTKGTYSCKGDKLIDSFIKNPSFKRLDQKNAFVTKGFLTYLPKFSTDGGTTGVVSSLQNALIKKGYLKISKPTGNYGRMTHSAVLLAAKDIDPGNETNQANGITKELYDKLVGSSNNTKEKEQWA